MRDTFDSARYPKLKYKDSSWYRNPKRRAEWLRGSKLSKKGRQIYACLELGTMNFDQEVAVVMIGPDQFRLMTVDDVARQTGLSERDVRRGMAELERFGLGEARSDDGGPVRKGHVELCCWAEPRQPDTPDPDEEIAAARCRNSPVPEWFPEEWAPVQDDGNRSGTLWSFAKRQKIKLDPEIAAARCRNPEVIERGNDLARRIENIEIEARAFMNEVCAPPVLTALYKEVRPVRPVRQTDAALLPAVEHLSKPDPSSSSSFSVPPDKEEEEEDLTPVANAVAEFVVATPVEIHDVIVSAREQNPSLTGEEIALAASMSVPAGYQVRHANYFPQAVRKTITSFRYTQELSAMRAARLAEERRRETWVPLSEPETIPEPNDPVPIPEAHSAADPEREASRRETAARIKAARLAEIEANKKLYAKPAGTERGFGMDEPLRNKVGSG